MRRSAVTTLAAALLFDGVLVIGAALPLAAQETATAAATDQTPPRQPGLPAAVEAELQRIFASPAYAPDRFGPARWLDGDSYTTVEPAADGRGADIVRYGAATGERRIYVSADRLVPSPGSDPLDLEDYQWSPDGRRLLVFTNSKRVWRDNTRGDFWVLDLRSGRLSKLGGPAAAPSTLMFAKFSPDGASVAYVREGDLYVQTLDDEGVPADPLRLTTTGSRTVVNGTTDWVYEEEFGLRDAFRWSPDGSHIAFWQFDMSGVRDYLLINDTDSLYSFTIPVQYPKAGTTNSAVRAGVIPAGGGETVWLDLPGDPRDDYLPRMEWSGARELVLQRLNRLQNTNHVLLADAGTGAVRQMFVDRDSAWLDVVDDWQWLDGGRRLLWMSERDGWRHLYTVDRRGRSKLLTPGAWDVMSVVAVDTVAGWIDFMASPDDATQAYLYRVPLAGGRARRLTPVDQPGTHGYREAPGGRWAFHTRSRFGEPPVTELVRLPGHTVARTLVSNDRLRAAAAAALEPREEFFKVTVGDGVVLDGWMIFPKDFDASKTYPLLVHVYTEPAAQTVRDAWQWGRGMWHRMLADQGYIVASVDNRGTPAPKGRAWRKVVYGRIGVLSSREQAEAVRVLTRSRPYLDSTRVGVWGWSGGGSATLNAMFRYPDVYTVGMAVAPVPDQRLYDTVYQERYMGLPQENAEGYRVGSPINFAEGLRGDLLLVHGTGDDNVHAQGSERLVNRLVALGKAFEYMSYPNRSHCICEGPGTTLHVYSLLTRYLLDHLPAGGRPLN